MIKYHFSLCLRGEWTDWGGGGGLRFGEDDPKSCSTNDTTPSLEGNTLEYSLMSGITCKILEKESG